MHFGMQRLDPPVEHLGKTGELGDVFHGNARVAQQLGGAAGGNQFHAQGCKLSGKIYQTGFVGNAEDGALNFHSSSSEVAEG